MARKRRKSKSMTTLLFLIACSVVIGLTMMLRNPTVRLIDSNTVVQAHLQDFRVAITNQTNHSTNANNEPFPVIITPFNGSVDPYYNIPSDGTNLWDNDPRLPEWLKAYLNWHKWRRQTWDPSRWADDRWMISQCLADQDKRRCGGAADRLKPLPSLLRMAYEQRRLLLIRWTKPATLETYLVPPKGGCDWRVPTWLSKVLANETNGRKFLASKVIRRYGFTNLTLMRTRYQSNTAGQDYYDSSRYNEDEPKFAQAFAPIWRLFFRPSPAVANIIQEHLTSTGLVPGQYVASHLRALYAIDSRPLQVIRRWTINAINCATQLRPGAPIFFTSDSMDATSIALHYGKLKHGTVVTHTPNPNPPLHIDGEKERKHRTPADYYDTFVDLYLIALAKCVGFNKGGYGHWGLLIGGNVTCRISHAVNALGISDNECHWHPGPNVSVAPALDASEKRTPIFLDPMP